METCSGHQLLSRRQLVTVSRRVRTHSHVILMRFLLIAAAAGQVNSSLAAAAAPAASPPASNGGPPRLSTTFQQRYVARRGDSVRLVCPVLPSRPPAPLFAWYKDADTIHDGWVRHRAVESVLRIKDLELADSGSYVCQATNGFGSARATMLLSVYDENVTDSAAAAASLSQLNRHSQPEDSSPRDHQSSKVDDVSEPRTVNVTSSVGDNVELRCPFNFNGLTLPRVQDRDVTESNVMYYVLAWLKMVDEETVNNSPRLHPSAVVPSANRTTSSGQRRVSIRDRTLHRLLAFGEGFYVSQLTVTNATKRDEGLYVCTVGAAGTPDGGVTSMTVNLHIVDVIRRGEEASQSEESAGTDDGDKSEFPTSVHLVPMATTLAVLLTLLMLLLAACISIGRRNTSLESQRRKVGVAPAGAPEAAVNGLLLQPSPQTSSTIGCAGFVTRNYPESASGANHQQQYLATPLLMQCPQYWQHTAYQHQQQKQAGLRYPVSSAISQSHQQTDGVHATATGGPHRTCRPTCHGRYSDGQTSTISPAAGDDVTDRGLWSTDWQSSSCSGVVGSSQSRQHYHHHHQQQQQQQNDVIVPWTIWSNYHRQMPPPQSNTVQFYCDF